MSKIVQLRIRVYARWLQTRPIGGDFCVGWTNRASTPSFSALRLWMERSNSKRYRDIGWAGLVSAEQPGQSAEINTSPAAEPERTWSDKRKRKSYSTVSSFITTVYSLRSEFKLAAGFGQLKDCMQIELLVLLLLCCSNSKVLKFELVCTKHIPGARPYGDSAFIVHVYNTHGTRPNRTERKRMVSEKVNNPVRRRDEVIPLRYRSLCEWKFVCTHSLLRKWGGPDGISMQEYSN